MPAHITPLTRNQLLELESLTNALAHEASSRPTSTLAADEYTTATTAAAATPRSSDSDACAPLTQAALRAHDQRVRPTSTHAMPQGHFVDVLHDPETSVRWRLYDKMLYLVWWSHRPTCCTQCGMREAWVASAESELRCAHCGAGAGSTELNDVVEDIPSGAAATANAGTTRGPTTAAEDRDEDGDGSGNDEAMAGNFYGAGEEWGQSAVTTYGFFFEWMERVRPLLPPAALHATPLPSGEALPAVLRAAYDMAGLLLVSGMTPSVQAVVRAGCLYLSLVLHRYPVPFPLYRLGAASSATGRVNIEDDTAQLQWVDVEYMASLLGVSLADYFESGVVATQYLQNVMAMTAAYAVPSVLWHPDRVAGRLRDLLALRVKDDEKAARATLVPRPDCSRSALQRLSPEQTAVCVALELARRVDAAPLVALAASTAAAVQHARRLGHWLDQLGFYPGRQIYTVSADETAVTRAAVDDDVIRAFATSADVALTTPTSPFRARLRWLLLSPCANALLHIFADVLHTPALAVTEMVMRSGLYAGPTRFREELERAMRAGDYAVLPLVRRLGSIVHQGWTSLYLALHSECRLPVLSTLHRLGGAENATRERVNALGQVLQRLLRPHGVGRWYQFNYVLRVVDETERHFNGMYFLSAWLPQEGLAVFTCLRSGRKTLTYNAHNHRISLCYVSAKERLVSRLQVRVLGPVVARIEDDTIKMLVDAVGAGAASEAWGRAVRGLDRCGRVRRRMRVPMLASRLDALASIRVTNAAVTSHVGLDSLLGWGETETLVGAPPQMDLLRLRSELQESLLGLPFAGLVYGLSENRAVAMYASLVALLEHIAAVLRRDAARKRARSDDDDDDDDDESVEGGEGRARPRPTPRRVTPAVPSTSVVNTAKSNWVEELLCDDFAASNREDDSGAELETDPLYGDVPTPGRTREVGSRTKAARRTIHHGSGNALYRRGLTLTPRLSPSPHARGVRPRTPTPPLAPNRMSRTSTRAESEMHGTDTASPPPFALSATTGAVERKEKGRHRRRAGLRTRVMAHLNARLPSYTAVLLGQATMGDGLERIRPSHDHPHDRPTSAVERDFTLLDADTCRTRLHRMHRFVTAYKAHKAALWEKARTGALTSPGNTSQDVACAPLSPHGRPREDADVRAVVVASGAVDDDDVVPQRTGDDGGTAPTTRELAAKQRRVPGRQRRRRERRERHRREKYGSSDDDAGVRRSCEEGRTDSEERTDGRCGEGAPRPPSIRRRALEQTPLRSGSSPALTPLHDGVTRMAKDAPCARRSLSPSEHRGDTRAGLEGDLCTMLDADNRA